MPNIAFDDPDEPEPSAPNAAQSERKSTAGRTSPTGRRLFDPPGNEAARRSDPPGVDAALRAALATLRKVNDAS